MKDGQRQSVERNLVTRLYFTMTAQNAVPQGHSSAHNHVSKVPSHAKNNIVTHRSVSRLPQGGHAGMASSTTSGTNALSLSQASGLTGGLASLGLEQDSALYSGVDMAMHGQYQCFADDQSWAGSALSASSSSTSLCDLERVDPTSNAAVEGGDASSSHHRESQCNSKNVVTNMLLQWDRFS